MNWMFFKTLGGPNWGYQIVNPLNEAIEKGQISTFSDKNRAIIGDIHYRILIVDSLMGMIKEKSDHIYKQLDDHDIKAEYNDDGAKISTGYAYPVDDRIRYELVAHLMNLFYQMNSGIELLFKLAISLQVAIVPRLTKKNASKYFAQLVDSHIDDLVAYRRVKSFRNYFTHHCTMRLAVEVTEMGYDLLIMKENLHDFRDDSKFFKLSEVSKGIEQHRLVFKLITQDLVEKLEYLVASH